MLAQVKTQLRNLKLSGISNTLELRMMEAQQNQLSYSEFLSMLLSDEFERRENNKITNLIKNAGLTNDKTLENFDFSFNPSINPIAIRELATCHFIEQGNNVFFIGPTGTGKTSASGGLELLRISLAGNLSPFGSLTLINSSINSLIMISIIKSIPL